MSDRSIGSRRAGSGAYLLVRASAVMIAGGALAFAALMADLPRWGYGPWQALFHGTAARILVVGWLAAVALHAYLGCDSILKDYVQSAWARLVGLMVIATLLLVLVAYGVVAVWA
ncbi:succinate dehydrogenase, hydrophobic membrane anchor protein [Acidiferrobacter sp.]|uniref:succinate dehydrogenase, hydrophobic membrane anchor protein n=1 Tax=Acidiferrobacter sp. TaxID=1872107 RepID=UPI00263840A4|nr:succinate dehydrogenase, hydrophobic membrane anchor protein [Acidiferrobacter sp.]